MKSKEQIGLDLRRLRGDKTQSAVASDLGISVAAVAMYEAGERVPRDELKAAMADYFGRTVGDLFFGEECHES